MKVLAIILLLSFVCAWISFWWESRNAPPEDDDERDYDEDI